ncbi:MAG: YkgJ family cysteine cluster protein [Verrucomicrobiota bacterium]
MNSASITRLSDDLSCAKSAEDFHAALRRALGAYEQLNSKRAEETGAALVCRAGCSLCCWLRVDVSAPEVFLIADTLRKDLPPVELEALRERLASHAELVAGMTVLEHATRNIACPLSRDGWCSVYAVRPHTCRRHHSQDLAACQFTFEHPDDLAFPGAHNRELFAALTEAMGLHAAVYEYYGFDDTVYELGSALAQALSDGDACWQRWLQKEQAFRRASVTPSG